MCATAHRRQAGRRIVFPSRRDAGSRIAATTTEADMNMKAGLWIDHRETFLVFVGDDAQATARMQSGVGKHVRFSGGNRPEDGAADDQRDRRFAAHLDRYYDEVIAQLQDAEAILLLGPGEAKGELRRRLEVRGLGSRVVGVEAADKMTVPQVEAKVRRFFLE
jgi:hypothetical protein